ncbi:hypothetical protein KKC88_02165 [Patescibacteria group bacterium]|nr:hypothetical protein [Patescibacteria group bacterium]MBU1673112.1 hypothetical protein [Patescibacteria group bacterium]MBU1963790.1 hypothetical protein [Patescibacteria group bacterium]
MPKKQCKNCNKTFPIHDRDLEFYKRIDVPEPTWCPDCRNMRRSAFRQERTLYNRKCDLCKKDVVSLYPADSEYTIYCHDCWWSDKWDPLEFGQEYNENKSFFRQFGDLMKKVPRVATIGAHNQNCEFVNYTNYSKDSYLIYGCHQAERCFYSWRIHHSKDSLDCLQTTKSELCYYGIDLEDSYNTHFAYQVKGCQDCSFIFDCRGCKNCFMSANLRNSEYVYKNKQLTREEYEKAISKHDLSSRKEQKKLWQEFKELIEKKAIHRSVNSINSENITGDNFINAKNCHYAFNVKNGENSSYFFFGEDIKDCYDSTFTGWPGELMYENLSGGVKNYNTHFGIVCWSCKDSYYSDNCHHSQNIFGCSGLKKNEYCILNKQYTEEEYLALKDKIVKKMKGDKEYGEFFPVEISPFGYNETMAQEFYPKKKEEVKNRGWQWQEDLPGTTGQETLIEIPDNIKEVKENILKEVLACEKCQHNYKIIKPELDLLKQLNLTVSKMCPNCRHEERWSLRNPFHLWNRQCMCTQPDHGHPGRCKNTFETSHDPEKLEIVYCERCYNKEIY